MAKGRRIRRRRRLATGAGGVAAAAVTVLVIVGAVALKEPPPDRQPLPPAASAPSPSSPPPVPAPQSVTTAPADVAPLGEVISLGTRSDDGREMVLYVSAIDESALPGVRFGLRVGYRNDDGGYEALMSTNEFKGSDRSFGFHATDGGELIEGTFVPVFGYFAGPAVRITSTVRGRPVEAKTAVWTEDPSVVIFWFPSDQVESSNVLSPLVAYDAKGQRLTK